MGTVLTIIAIGALIGLLVGVLSGDAENIPGSVAAGAASAFGCMIQLMLMALPFLIGIWLIGAVFG